jgi:CDGSH-type Zn-finger protein
MAGKVEGSPTMAEVELIIRKNGSTLVKGEVVLKDQDGNVITPPNTPFALCRCGASNNKPFCDGSHKRIGFDDTPRAAEKTRSAEESNGDLEAQS